MKKYLQRIKDIGAKKLALFAIVGLAILGILFFSFQVKKNQDFLRNPSTTAQDEQKSLVDKVKQSTNLPTDEKPTIATVYNVKDLKDKEFFKNAKEGYNVLLYPKANRRILYDPMSNKIINDAPITTSQEPQAKR